MSKIQRIIARENVGAFPCPVCRAGTRVLDSRPHPNAWRRRRACPNGHRFTSFETVADLGKDFAQVLEGFQSKLEEVSGLLAAEQRRLSEIMALIQTARKIEEARYGNAGPRRVAHRQEPIFTVLDGGCAAEEQSPASDLCNAS